MPAPKYIDRPVPRISLKDFECRVDEVTSQLCDAAENIGFFVIVDHGLADEDIDSIFEQSRRFFALPHEAKATVSFLPKNVGWEYKGQIRPSTGVADEKETYQLQFSDNMKNPDRWISDTILPGFKSGSLDFMHKAQAVSEKLMRCFARGLGFDDEFFNKAHDVTRPNSQSVLRLLHYFEVPKAPGKDYHRAGPHADWDLLTLLFQREGQCGLEICPGREVVTEFGAGDEWTRIEPKEGEIVCNIGDLLMFWSDDRFKSTLHRVATPLEAEGLVDGEKGYHGERYSVGFFNQPCSDAIIRGPKGKYPAVTGEEFNKNAMKRYYDALVKKRETLEKGNNPGVEKQTAIEASA
ncbi:MAG: hypothetical protein Q9227_006590 [Pyrenula ochraceoflavens]